MGMIVAGLSSTQRASRAVAPRAGAVGGRGYDAGGLT